MTTRQMIDDATANAAKADRLIAGQNALLLSDERIRELAARALWMDFLDCQPTRKRLLGRIVKAIRTAAAEATKVEWLDGPDRPGHWWYLDHGAKEPNMWLVHPNMEEALSFHGSSRYPLNMFSGKWVFVPAPEWKWRGKNDDVER